MKFKSLLFATIASLIIPSLSFAESVKKLTAAQAIKEIGTLFRNKAELKGVGVNQPCYITAVNLESFIGGLSISITSQNKKYFSSVELMENHKVVKKITTVYSTYINSMYVIPQQGDSSHIEIWSYTSGPYKGLINVTLSPTEESDLIGLSCRLAK